VRLRLEAHRRAGNLVVFLHDAHAEDDREFEKFPPHCIAGTWGGRIIDDLTPQKGEQVLAKTRYSGFYGTDLEKILAAYGPDEVEVVGVCTSICVMDTVGGLANRDYRATVPEAGVADFDAEAHRFALQRMKRLYGATIQ
jgi:nicotinamidase-related amidase